MKWNIDFGDDIDSELPLVGRKSVSILLVLVSLLLWAILSVTT